MLRSVKALVQLCNTSTNLAGRVEVMWPNKTGKAQPFFFFFFYHFYLSYLVFRLNVFWRYKVARLRTIISLAPLTYTSFDISYAYTFKNKWRCTKVRIYAMGSKTLHWTLLVIVAVVLCMIILFYADIGTISERRHRVTAPEPSFPFEGQFNFEW